MADKILVLKDVKKYYTGTQAVVMGLGGVDLSFARGEFVAITGESGSGKSTLAHVMGGILPYESGEMYFNGAPTSHFDSLDYERYRRDNVSFISQNYGILPGATVWKNVVSALLLSGMGRQEAAQAAQKLLRQVELWDLRRRRAAKLSSGQKQRLSIARALAKPAPILIADEPTGNLDAENSAKVISLLAEAARDRLVILVTHEFAEAEALATRRIILSDGLVVQDIPLRDPEEPAPLRGAQRKQKRALSLYVAGLQTGSRPIWATTVAAFFALTAFAVFAFLGVFIINLDDTSTYQYDAKTFPNGSKERIIVSTLDGSPMTQEDYDALLKVKHVTALEPNGYVSDVFYGYREGIDYVTKYELHISGDFFGFHSVSSFVSFANNLPCLQTVPLLPKGRTFLAEGKLPESFYEVAVRRGVAEIGDTIDVLIKDSRYLSDPIPLQVQVVGLTDYGSGIYFSRDLGRMFTQMIKVSQDHNSNPRLFFYLPHEEVEEGTFFPSTSYAHTLGDLNIIDVSFAVIDPGREQTEITLRKMMRIGDKDSHDYPFSKLILTSYQDFDALTWNSPSEQVSLTISDYAYTDRVIAAVQKLGYIAASPYRLGSTKQVPELAKERMQTLQICLTALIAVVALQILLLRALFSVQTDSFRILSNIGLTSRTARASVLWQILLFTLLGQVVGGLAVWLCGCNGVERIEQMLRYLPPANILILSGVHLAASLLAAVLVIRGMEKQVYPLAGKYRDLNMGEGKEDAL